MPFELDTDTAALQAYLEARGWIGAGERVRSAAPAGAGNMNVTLRVQTDRQSLVLKQSRPYVVRYPTIPAPVERIDTEVRFYEVAARDPALAARLPRLLGFDADAHLAAFEDLGAALDLTSLYRGERLAREDLAALCAFARALHALPLDAADREALRNAPMRALDHEHIFEVPYREDGGGVDLDARTPGLGAVARSVRADDALVARVIALGLLYRDVDGPSLLHGDFYPGSFLATTDGLRVIDPEFAFPGPAEFDLGVLAAHLVLAGGEDDAIDRVAAHYAAPLDTGLLRGFAGAEILRRLLGVAQLPLDPQRADLARKRRWIALARRWILEH